MQSTLTVLVLENLTLVYNLSTFICSIFNEAGESDNVLMRYCVGTLYLTFTFQTEEKRITSVFMTKICI